MGRVTARRRASHLTASEEGSASPSGPKTLVVEEPLEIRLNGTPLTVTMRTPGSDVELAQGFLLTEGVIAGRDGCAHGAVLPGSRGDGLNTYNVLDVTLAPGVPLPDVDVRRNFYTTSSCGICGKASLDAVATISRHCPGDDPTVVPAETLTAMPGQLRAAQKVFASTGGLHGAALFNADGTLLVVREDIGRHNAVDKVSVGRSNTTESRCPARSFWSVGGRPSNSLRRPSWRVCRSWPPCQHRRRWPSTSPVSRA